jgi:hypothetical protein
MLFISFIYNIKNESTKYFGKCNLDYIDDINDGLDKVICTYLIAGLNKYRRTYNLPILTSNDLSVGVLSYSYNDSININSSEDEMKAFDFYYNVQPQLYYVNGNIYTDN